MLMYLFWAFLFMGVFGILVQNKGWSFWRMLKVLIPIVLVARAFIAYGPVIGCCFTVILASALFVYGDAVREKIRFAWFYGLLAFFFPLFGILIYLVRKWLHERSAVQSGQVINYSDGQIAFHR